MNVLEKATGGAGGRIWWIWRFIAVACVVVSIQTLRPVPLVESSADQQEKDYIPPAELVRPCLHLRYGGVGWGNLLYLFFYYSLANWRHGAAFPCVKGYYGELVSGLFLHAHACTVVNTTADDTLDKQEQEECTDYGAHPPWKEIISFIDQFHYNSTAPDLWKLNATFVQEMILSPVNLSLPDLRSSCAVHLRFGDKFIRNNSQFQHDQRLCNGITPSATGSGNAELECFDQLIDRVQTHCPDKQGVGQLYLASDYVKFIQYFAAKQPHRIFRSSFGLWENNDNNENKTHPRGITTHNVDLGMHLQRVDLENATFQALLRDWLALVLAKKRTAISGSSFSDSAFLVSI